MLDNDTMRIALGGVSLTVLILFYLGVYRPTRSSFSGWWSVSLLCAGASTSLLLLNGSDLQIVANPLSNLLSVVGVTCVWFATRTLRRGKGLPLWVIGVAPVAILVPTFLQDPAENIWAGNGMLFSYMGALFVAGSTEMWLAWYARRRSPTFETNDEAVVALLVSALASSALGAFYVLRAVLYFVVGPNSEVFQTVVGTAPTTGILLVSLVAVTFSVSAVGWDQQTQELRRRAMEDDLTGLLGRTEFRLRSDRALTESAAAGVEAYLVVADLDHFKAVNDEYGHSAGDRALLEFAATVRDALGPGEVAGRLGGEEFGMVLLGVDRDAAIARLDALSEAFAAQSDKFDFGLPTVSYGIASFEEDSTLSEVYERADHALYRAKADGRDRAVAYTGEAS